jgi:sialate O-acetylesterase
MNKKSTFLSIHLALLLSMLMTSQFTEAKVKLPSIISDGMVMQQQSDVRLWGSADPQTNITISTSWGEKNTVKSDKNGKWLTTIHTPEASFDKQTISFSDGESVSLSLYIGEVWLASGQSNMEMPLKGFAGACTKNGALDALHAAQESPYVRMFNVEKKQTYTRRNDCNGKWMEPTFENAMEFSATAYYFASAMASALGVPVGIVNCSYGGARVESWMSLETCSEYPDVATDSVSIFTSPKSWERAIAMYNAMFWPIHQYTVKGIIWYQGCSNVGTKDYAARLERMVKQWRSEMNLGDIPFYQVQIAPYIYNKEDGVDAAYLREQQFIACNRIANCDIVCTNDLVEPYEKHNIHPREKRTVGLRLALLALNKTYDRKDIACTGPRYDASKFSINGNTISVGFVTNEYGICRNYGLEGFEIAGSDRVFHTAKAVFNWQTNTVDLTSPDVPQPIAARYCFKDFQIGNVIGGNELPLFPFRTDDW